MRKSTIAICLVLFLGAGVFALPGAHRALVPWLFGLERIAPGVWTDFPPQAGQVLQDLQQAQARIAPFWQYEVHAPRMIVCHSDLCAEVFGLKVLGLTYGAQLVLLGAEGANPTIMAHELSHIALHEYLGLRDLWHQRFPAWFDEGLAVYLSEDPRMSPPDELEEALWIEQAHSLRDWGRMVTADTWPEAYSAALRMVQQIVAETGEDGLREMVLAVGQGADFHAELGRHAPSLLDRLARPGP